MKVWITRDNEFVAGKAIAIWFTRPKYDGGGWYPKIDPEGVPEFTLAEWPEISHLKLEPGQIIKCNIIPTDTGFEVKAVV